MDCAAVCGTREKRSGRMERRESVSARGKDGNCGSAMACYDDAYVDS